MIKFDDSQSNLEAVFQSLFFIESALKILEKFTKKIAAKSYKLEVSSLTKIQLVLGYFSTAFLSSKNPWAYFPEQASMVTSGNKAYNWACQKARQHTKFCAYSNGFVEACMGRHYLFSKNVLLPNQPWCLSFPCLNDIFLLSWIPKFKTVEKGQCVGVPFLVLVKKVTAN